MTQVVDTNVAVVANGGERVNAPVDCQARSVQTLEDVVTSGCICVDDLGAIMSAYDKCLNPRGAPGVGDLFYRHILNNLGNKDRVREHNLTHPRARKLNAAFHAEGTLSKFDPDDRVFAICGVVARAPVLVATDSDWTEHEAGLAACGVRIRYVCGKETAVKAVAKKLPKKKKQR